MHAHLRFFPLPPENVGMHHAAHDGAGPDDSHLHDDIVKRFRPGARQRRLLRPALYLEHADCVSALKSVEYGRIFVW